MYIRTVPDTTEVSRCSVLSTRPLGLLEMDSRHPDLWGGLQVSCFPDFVGVGFAGLSANRDSDRYMV
jgi:hypothetical protein